MDWITLFLFPIARNVTGWMQNAARDGKFQWYEWRRLIETLLKIIVPSVILVIGLGWDELYASAIVTVLVILIDQLYNSFVRKEGAKK